MWSKCKLKYLVFPPASRLSQPLIFSSQPNPPLSVQSVQMCPWQRLHPWASEGPRVGERSLARSHIGGDGRIPPSSQVLGFSILCSSWQITLPSCQVKSEARWFDKWFLLLSNLPSLPALTVLTFPFLGVEERGGEKGRGMKSEKTKQNKTFHCLVL